MRQETFGAGRELDDLVRQEVRLDGGDAVAFDALHTVQGTDQVEESLTRRLAEVTDVYARDHNLLGPFARRRLRLGDRLRNASVTALATGDRHRAIGAEIVTAVLHLQPIAGAVSPRARGREGGDFAPFRMADLSFLLLFQIIEMADNIKLILCAKHEVHPFDLGDRLGLQLRVTARHDDVGPRMFRDHLLDRLTILAVRHLGHGTGVDDAHIRHLIPACLAETMLKQHLANRGRLRKIQFAAKRVESHLFILEY